MALAVLAEYLQEAQQFQSYSPKKHSNYAASGIEGLQCKPSRHHTYLPYRGAGKKTGEYQADI